MFKLHIQDERFIFMKIQFLYLSEVTANALLLPLETVITISGTILVQSPECTSFSHNFMAHYTFSFVEKNPRVIFRLSYLAYSRVWPSFSPCLYLFPFSLYLFGNILKINILYMCGCFVCMYVCIPCMPGAQRGQCRVLDPWKRSYRSS